jgi:hypothetical protein
MLETSDSLVEGEVLQEFEFEGRPASIVHLQGNDAETFADDLGKLANGLAINQETKIPSKITEKVRARLGLFDRGFGERVENCTRARTENMSCAIREGAENVNFYGVVVDDRLVSTIGVKKREKMANGRQIHEFTSASTLQDVDESGQLKYAKKGLYGGLKKTLFERYMAEDPDAVWMSDSRNQTVIDKWRRSGWTVAEIDDTSEFAAIFRKRNAKYLDSDYRPLRYKIGFLDPKA